MSIRNLILGINSVTASYLIHCDSLLQNATVILLKNATYYKMCQAFYYKMRQFCYKTQLLLRNMTFSTNCTSTQSNFIEIALRHGCSPVNMLHISRTSFPKDTSAGLLLSYLKNSNKNSIPWMSECWFF